jgi:hypothetical protein
MNLDLRPGKDPADPTQIEVWAGKEKIENVFIESASYIDGKLVAKALVTKVSNETDK